MDENSKVVEVRPPWLLHQRGHSLTPISQNTGNFKERLKSKGHAFFTLPKWGDSSS
ncbi:hypothetical protein BVRB_6g145070 [Beta vulgaris subsp. vulgaris]|uniref:Uncharacterized protein n=1 Tax=Beta vulgaris subsp. vulgaris TaxID=3555 RepID=A0A0J8C345_BETVV|nr:hypothetical protein BVRB_6g145070 [Beta vulgaris subsp. vulgaris]